MLKAAIYARYSSDNQREESIDAQVRAMADYAAANNITIVKKYIDEALSAKTDNRPQFINMISDAKKGLYDVIICHKLDRFARNRYDSALYKKVLKDHGVRLISVLENFDDSPESIILESVLEGMAEYYSANLAREVMKGLKENALQCLHTGGKPPFGYDVENKRYVINESEAEAVRQIFNMIASGHSVGDVIMWLKNNHYKSKHNTQFTTGSINSIIKNEKYKGVYVYGKTKRVQQSGVKKNIEGDEVVRIENGIPAIIDKELWDKVNKLYSGRQHKSGGQAKAKETYLLSGLIFCGLCGGSMCGNKVKSGRNKSLRITYKCNKRKAKKTCLAKDIRKDVAEGAVLDAIDKTLSEKGISEMVDYFETRLKAMSKELPDEIKILKSELDKTEKQINSMIEAIMDGIYSPTIKDKLSSLEREKEDYINRIGFYEKCSQLTTSPDRQFIRDLIKNDMGIKNKSPEEQKRIIRTYVKRIEVHPHEIIIYTEVDTKNGAEPYQLVSTYSYKQPINKEPEYFRI